jgi:hypothetical protein
MENHDSRIAYSPEVPTDERASSLNPQPAADGGSFAAPVEPPEDADGTNAPPSPPPADKRFGSEAEERAYWAGVRIGMENAAAARAAKPASGGGAEPPPRRIATAPGDPCPDLPRIISDTLGDLSAQAIQDAVEDAFPPGGRKPRHDGFTPEKMGEFLRDLAATGVVEHAAATVGVSAQAAYALRNRRGGRAFARMWDAILINRSRDRLASELSSRAIAGCVSIRKKDGIIVSEYHHYDNRLAMSMLTRLDRLAEKEANSEAHLRALSEDMEEFIDCLAIGEDADAFVERRRPAQPEPEALAAGPAAAPAQHAAPVAHAAAAAPDEPAEEDPFPDIAAFARMCRIPDYLGVPPGQIPVADLDPSQRGGWSPDQYVRFYRSGFAPWLAFAEEEDGDEIIAGRAATLQFDTCRAAAAAALALYGSAAPAGPDEEVETDDLENSHVETWSEEQRARAGRSGMLRSLPVGFWQAFAAELDGGDLGLEDADWDEEQ